MTLCKHIYQILFSLPCNARLFSIDGYVAVEPGGLGAQPPWPLFGLWSSPWWTDAFVYSKRCAWRNQENEIYTAGQSTKFNGIVYSSEPWSIYCFSVIWWSCPRKRHERQAKWTLQDDWVGSKIYNGFRESLTNVYCGPSAQILSMLSIMHICIQITFYPQCCHFAATLQSNFASVAKRGYSLEQIQPHDHVNCVYFKGTELFILNKLLSLGCEGRRPEGKDTTGISVQSFCIYSQVIPIPSKSFHSFLKGNIFWLSAYLLFYLILSLSLSEVTLNLYFCTVKLSTRPAGEMLVIFCVGSFVTDSEVSWRRRPTHPSGRGRQHLSA